MSKNFRETLRERMQDPDFRAEWRPWSRNAKSPAPLWKPGKKPHDPGTAGRSNRHPPSGYQPAGTWYGEPIASHLETACGRLGHDAEDRVCAQRISKHKFDKNAQKAAGAYAPAAFCVRRSLRLYDEGIYDRLRGGQAVPGPGRQTQLRMVSSVSTSNRWILWGSNATRTVSP